MAIKYTEDQQKAIDRLVSFCLSSDRVGKILLQGQAGTGKSTIIQEVIRQVGHSKMVVLTAPTNKATKVLNDMAYKYAVPVADVRTIYSMLNLVLKPDGSVKSISHRGVSELEANAQIVVVDEASMLNEAIYSHLMFSQDSFGYKLIFIGDDLQLPPVNEEESPAFIDESVEKIELTSVVRQAENSPIIEFAKVIRQAILDGSRREVHKWLEKNQKRTTDSDGNLYVLDRKKFRAWMKQAYNTTRYEEDGDFVRGVAWRNVTVNDLNEFARIAIYGDEPPYPFAQHENVLSADIVKEWYMRVSLREEGEIVMKVDDEASVISVTTIEKHPMLPKSFSEVEVYEVTLSTAHGIVKAYMPTAVGKKQYNKILSRLQDTAKKDRSRWADFWGFKESFADIRPAHALTSHRSQGSTYENCFVDVGDIFRNRNTVESLKSLYVAATRASENLFMTGV